MSDLFGKVEAHDLSQGLLRQRRNLMAVSLIMIFLVYAGASFGSANILGIELRFSNPNAIMHFVWLFLIYYLFRYYQYFRQEPTTVFESAFHGVLSDLAAWKILRLKRAAFPGIEFEWQAYDFRHMEVTSFWKRQISVHIDRGEGRARERATLELDIRLFMWSAIRAGVSVLLNTSYVTDYYLPFGLALLAMVVAIV